MMTRVLIFFAVAVLAASTFGQNGAALASDRVYLIGPSDEITGKVLGESQFDFVVIVDEDGKIETARQVCLLDLPLNKAAVVNHVTDQSSEILELLKHMQIGIGTKLEVKKKFGFDHSMEIKIGRQSSINISEQLAKNIFVKYGT